MTVAAATPFHMMCVMRRVMTSRWNGVIRPPPDGPDAVRVARKDVFPLDYIDLLRRLSVHDAGVAAEVLGEAGPVPAGVLDPKTLALVRLAALVAVGGAVPSYGAHTDAAVDAGATSAEIVDVLIGVAPVVGLPCVVSAAPRVALALGCNVDDAFGIQPGA